MLEFSYEFLILYHAISQNLVKILRVVFPLFPFFLFKNFFSDIFQNIISQKLGRIKVLIIKISFSFNQNCFLYWWINCETKNEKCDFFGLEEAFTGWKLSALFKINIYFGSTCNHAKIVTNLLWFLISVSQERMSLVGVSALGPAGSSGTDDWLTPKNLKWWPNNISPWQIVNWAFSSQRLNGCRYKIFT